MSTTFQRKPELPSCVALIPARAGSKRIAGKNLRSLNGHPLLAYTIRTALDAAIFDSVIVSTEDERTAQIARHYGAEVPFMRPIEMAGDLSPDIEWVDHTLRTLRAGGREFAAFAILRPTSPFRAATTLGNAWNVFRARFDADSLRAVEPCRQHPGKMWVQQGEWLRPLLTGGPVRPPWHSMPYQALPPVLAQNASLELAWCRVVYDTGTIAGDRILGFPMPGDEGFDINGLHDWLIAEQIARRADVLPRIPQSPLPGL
jgi:CMP-N,N'-diacetyllegionaminic acid synthase